MITPNSNNKNVIYSWGINKSLGFLYLKSTTNIFDSAEGQRSKWTIIDIWD